ncbi:unnamed protein product [Brassica rapa]|uniref:Uncharacterized protein n=1 Tax=Brassica campestris TaxID=3711 RepID=A0A8D9CTY2_BRACM|nr:unnamed protein product [Brassica rapa]
MKSLGKQRSCADGHTRTAMDIMCVLTDSHGRPVCAAHVGQNHPNSLNAVAVHNRHTRTHMDSHGRPVCADGHTWTATDVLCVLTDTHGRPVCADGHPRTSFMDVLCVLTDSHRQPRTSCVCRRTPTDVLCVLNRQPTWAKITQTVHGKGQRAESKDGQRADMCTDGQPRTSCPQMSCVCWRTPTDVLCVQNRQPTQPTRARTVHGKGQRAESKDQRADMCTDGQPRTSSTDFLCVLTDTHRHTHTHVLCVLTDTHRRPVCADGQPLTATNVLCVLADTHRHTRIQTDSHGCPVYSPRGPKSPKQSTGRASVRRPRTNVLKCELIDRHRRPVCADGHRQTHTDSHRRPVCAGGHPRTSCVHPTWAKITRTVHGKGQRAESKDQRAYMSTDVLCVLTDTHGQPRTFYTHTHVLCVMTDTHRRPPRTSCVCWRTPTDTHGHTQTATDVLCVQTNTKDVLCVLMDTHGRPMCTEKTAHVGQNHPNRPREGPAC